MTPIGLMGTFDDLSEWIIDYQMFVYGQVFPDEALRREYPIINRVAFSQMKLDRFAFHGSLQVDSELPVLILTSLFKHMNIHVSNHSAMAPRYTGEGKMRHTFRVTMMIDDFEPMAVMTKLTA